MKIFKAGQESDLIKVCPDTVNVPPQPSFLWFAQFEGMKTTSSDNVTELWAMICEEDLPSAPGKYVLFFFFKKDIQRENHCAPSIGSPC